MGVGEVGVGVTVAEVFQGCAVAHASRRCTQQPLEQASGVGPGDGMHGVKGQGEVAANQIADLIEVEQLLHQGNEIIDAVDNHNLHRADAVQTRGIQWDFWSLNNRVLLQGFGALEHRIGEGGGGGATVGAVDLDAEVTVLTTRVVAGGKDDAADGLALPDQIGGGRRGEDSAGGDDHLAEAVGRAHPQDHVDGTAVAVTAVAPHHKGAALYAWQRAKRRFNRNFRGSGAPQTGDCSCAGRRSWLLVGERVARRTWRWVGSARGRDGHHNGCRAICGT